MAQTTADIRIAACPGWVRHNAYFVTRCLVSVTAAGASGEIANVSQVFRPDGRGICKHWRLRSAKNKNDSSGFEPPEIVGHRPRLKSVTDW
jgi:hypothetical protein